MLVKTSEGMKDVSIQKPDSKGYNVTKDNYVVPEGEENRFHVILEVLKFNAETGERISKARIQKFGAKAFESGGVLSNLKKQGYTVTVLHDPKEWNSKNAEVAAEKNAERAKATADKKAQLEQEKINSGVAEALKAMGLTPEAIAAMNQPKKQETVKTESKPTIEPTSKTTEVKTEQKASKDEDKK